MTIRVLVADDQALVPGAYSESAMLAVLSAISDEVALSTPLDD